MSKAISPPRRILHLVVADFPADKLAKILESSPGNADTTKIFSLTEATAREALELIFAADTVAVWSKLEPILSRSS